MYEFMQKLGTGGQASVFKVRDLLTGQYLACKVYKVNSKGDFEKLKEFVNEVNILRQIRHKNLIKYKSNQVV